MTRIGRRATIHDGRIRPSPSPTRQALPALLLALTVLASPAAAQAPVEGTLTAASLQFDEEAPLQAEAYLLGFRRNGHDASPYAWSFQAERLDVALTTRHYVASHEVDNRTETRAHDDAHGFLLERYPLAYLMATSATPDDQGATFGLRMDLSPTHLVASNEIDFDIKSSAAEEEPFPFSGPLYENEVLPSDQPYHAYRKPWPSLEQKFSDRHDSITLSGDFVVRTYDVVFQVRDGAGQTTTYNATYGGWRGIDAEAGPTSPPTEYDVTEVELRLTNATFTFRPAGRPMQLNIRSTEMNVTGDLYLSDVQGTLHSGTGIERTLDGALVELDAKDLHLGIRPLNGKGETARLRLAFEGIVHTATVDGRALDLEEVAEPAGSEPAGAEVPGTVPAPPLPAWNVNWWFILLLVVSAPLAWAGIRRASSSHRARVDPEYVTRQGQEALDEGRITRAHTLATRVLHHHPEYQDAVALKAMLHLRRRQHGDALSFLEPYLLGPADGGGLLSLIYCVALREEKGLEKARAFFQETVKQRPAIMDVAREYPGLIDDFLFGRAEPDDQSYI